MRGYRRFVAYVYEYRRGRKEENCGYIRVEARDDDCNMEVHLKCPGLPGLVSGEIYGFVRKQDGMEGYLLHQCRTLQDGMECSFETETDRLGNMPVALADLGGMIIQTEGGAFFGTEWDDHPIQPDEFYVHSEKNALPENQENTEKDMKDTLAEKAPEKMQESQTENISKNVNEALAEKASEKVQENQTENMSKNAKDNLAEKVPEKVQENQTENMSKNVKDNQAEKASGKVRESLEENMSENVQEDIGENASEYVQKDLTGNPEADLRIADAKIPDMVDETENDEDIPDEEISVQEETDSANVSEVSETETAFEPFPDGEICDCRKINAADLRKLHPRDRGLRNNRFVSYSYHQFGYLMIGRLTNGQYILGLPGGYDQQERFMANSFGFPYFKQSADIELPRVRGGYWYRLINAPDFN